MFYTISGAKIGSFWVVGEVGLYGNRQQMLQNKRRIGIVQDLAGAREIGIAMG